MEFAPLHQVQKFKQDCAEVLNDEWKRSLTARLHSLEKSRDSFPICLVLLEFGEDGKQFVVGHSMLSVVRGQPVQSCLVESVVVRKSHRGKGYGRIVMQKTEEFAARRGYEVMYLTTHDKQKFYEHLGYEYCSPVVTFSSEILPEQLANKLMGSLTVNTPGGDNNSRNQLHTNTNQDQGELESSNKQNFSKNPAGTCAKNTTKAEITRSQAGAPPPPAMAPPPAPVPPPPPVAPPPPPVNCKSLADKSGDKTVTRWDPSCVSWMKKRIV